MIKKYEEPGSNSHPHLEEKNYCQNQDQRFSSKRRTSQHRFKSMLSSYEKTRETLLAIKLGIYPLNQHQMGKWWWAGVLLVKRNTEQDQPFTKIGMMYSEKDGNALI
jgi:hypothetical protein